jgi:hypothetical protein
MHQPIRENLEEYLTGSTGNLPREFRQHLETCEDCASELRMFQAQSEMFASLRVDSEAEPAAGFYARIMDRIEVEGRSSIWSVLLQPNFGRRLAMASAVLVVLLGTYFVTVESSEPGVTSAADVVFTGEPAAQVATGNQDSLQQQRQRDAVLVNLAAYHE